MSAERPNDDVADPVRPNAPLWRRLAAILYDGLLLIAVWFAATLPILAARDGAALPAGHVGFQLYLLVVTLCYFAGFWRFGGQTAGMRAWRLRVIGQDGRTVGLARAFSRAGLALVSAACLGLGFLWSLFAPRYEAWHDTLSGTRLVVIPARGKV